MWLCLSPRIWKMQWLHLVWKKSILQVRYFMYLIFEIFKGQLSELGVYCCPDFCASLLIIINFWAGSVHCWKNIVTISSYVVNEFIVPFGIDSFSPRIFQEPLSDTYTFLTSLPFLCGIDFFCYYSSMSTLPGSKVGAVASGCCCMFICLFSSSFALGCALYWKCVSGRKKLDMFL